MYTVCDKNFVSAKEIAVDQACAMYGPQATSSPWPGVIRPARSFPNIIKSDMRGVHNPVLI